MRIRVPEPRESGNDAQEYLPGCGAESPKPKRRTKVMAGQAAESNSPTSNKNLTHCCHMNSGLLAHRHLRSRAPDDIGEKKLGIITHTLWVVEF